MNQTFFVEYRKNIKTATTKYTFLQQSLTMKECALLYNCVVCYATKEKKNAEKCRSRMMMIGRRSIRKGRREEEEKTLKHRLKRCNLLVRQIHSFVRELNQFPFYS